MRHLLSITDLSVEELDEGTWTISVTAEDGRGNTAGHTLFWQYVAGEARPGETVSWYAPHRAEKSE